MSQTELARRIASYGLPFHQPTVQRVESGERPIRLNEAIVLCDILALELPEALQPETVERATQALLNFLRTARRDWEYILGNLGDLRDQVDAARQVLLMERDLYVHAIQAMGGDYDGDLAQSAEELADVMYQVEQGLRQIYGADGGEDYGEHPEAT